MCARSVVRVARSLVGGGREGSTPVAVVTRGTREGEEVYLTTLAELAASSPDRRFESPSIAIVGEVAAFPARLAALRSLYREVSYDEIVA
jgi:siroheme synthase